MIQINADSKTLRILDRFQVDSNLPKYKKPPVDKKNTSGTYIAFQNSSTQAISNNVMNVQEDAEQSSQGTFAWMPNRFIPSDMAIDNEIRIEMNEYMKQGKVRRLVNAFCQIMRIKRTPKEPVKKTAIQAFDIVFKSAEQLKAFEDRQDAFDKMILDAKQAGQISLVQSLMEQRKLKIYENQLFSINVKKFITQSAIVDIAMASQKGLRIDYIKNFIDDFDEV